MENQGFTKPAQAGFGCIAAVSTAKLTSPTLSLHHHLNTDLSANIVNFCNISQNSWTFTSEK
jgi:hypothetical protein